MPWIPITTIASSAGASADMYKSKPMKSNKITWLIAFLISALIVSYFVTIITDNRPMGQMYNQYIADREQDSINMKEPVYDVEKTFFLNHSDGASVTMQIVKIRCCDRVAAFTKFDQELIAFGYFNKVFVNQIGTTTKQEVAQIYLTSVVHELTHLVTVYHLEKGANPLDRTVQEKMAYDLEFLLSQIIELSNDGYISLQII